MKSSVIAGLILFLNASSFGQFKNGYMVNFNGDTTRGFISPKNWDRTPRAIIFKKGIDAEQLKYTIDDVSAFYVDEEFYRRVITKVDKADYKDSNTLTTSPAPEFHVDTVFLQLLFKEEVSLHYLKDIVGKIHFFIETAEKGIEPLIFKKYTKEVPNPAMPGFFKKVIFQNQEYKRQLYYRFRDVEGMESVIEATKYTLPSMMNLFEKYYSKKKRI
jgi:hypothetical protein